MSKPPAAADFGLLTYYETRNACIAGSKDKPTWRSAKAGLRWGTKLNRSEYGWFETGTKVPATCPR